MRKGTIVLTSLLISTYLIPACENDDSPAGERLGVDEDAIYSWGRSEEPSDEAPLLNAARTCSELGEAIREAFLEESRERVLAARESALITPCYSGGGGGFGCDAGAYDEMSMAADDGSQSNGATEYSTTNTQEVGVDEADFIKNDGEYIYVVSGGEFQIVRAWPAEETETIARHVLGGTPRSLYVHNDRAIIFTYNAMATTYSSYNYQGSWYYNNDNDTATTTVSVLDITDRTQPVLEREIELSGAYVNSRRINDGVHLVVALRGPVLPEIRTYPSISACDAESIEDVNLAYSDLIYENSRVIHDAEIDVFLPTITDRRFNEDGSAVTERELFEDCSNVLVPESINGTDFLTVLSFDISEPTSSNVTSIIGDQGVVYASGESLYVASVQYNGGWYWGNETTTLHRFGLDQEPAMATYEASGSVEGRVLNQFSMGEHEGHLRIATTTGHIPSPNAYNSVFVVGQEEDELVVVGAVTPIAPTEDIRSARFVGDRGFVVTFKKTDPLFVLDLRDPENPRVEGELHIPGFSTYMHMMDHDHLLTIGYDADDQGSFAWFTGIQLQIFDVSDMSNPRVAHRHVIGTRGTSSEATTNHLAFNYFAPRDLLALPMAICEDSGEGDDYGGSYGDVMTFDGLMIFDVTTDGIRERGRVAHPFEREDGGYGGGCSNWWTNPNSGVLRSIVMDDFVYSVAGDRIIVAHLDELSDPVAAVDLPVTFDEPNRYW